MLASLVIAMAAMRRWTYLSSLSGEVVGALQGTGNTLLDAGVATVIGRQDGVLEATGVQDVNIELAVLALLSDGDAGADGGDVGVEDESHDAPVGGDLGADGALGAAGSTIGDTADLDLFEVISKDVLEIEH